MGYVEENLMPGEQIMYRANLHWIIYATPLFFGLVGIVIVASSFDNRYQTALGGMGVLFLIVAGLLGLSRGKISGPTELADTNRQEFSEDGVMCRLTVEHVLA